MAEGLSTVVAWAPWWWGAAVLYALILIGRRLDRIAASLDALEREAEDRAKARRELAGEPAPWRD